MWKRKKRLKNLEKKKRSKKGKKSYVKIGDLEKKTHRDAASARAGSIPQ